MYSDIQLLYTWYLHDARPVQGSTTYQHTHMLHTVFKTLEHYTMFT